VQFQIKLFHVTKQLSHLVRFRHSADVLKIQRAIRPQVFIDTMTAADAIECLSISFSKAAKLPEFERRRFRQCFFQ
jgi:hypothetical protein